MDESGDATQGVEGENLIYIRKADGSPAVQLASKFSGRALSPDGRFLLTAVDEQNDTLVLADKRSAAAPSGWRASGPVSR